MTKDDLTPRERAVFDALPREEAPSSLLEERTVRALRDQGLLRRAHGSPNDRGLFLSGGLLAVAAAVVCAALIGAFALGQNQGAGQTREAMLAMHEQDGALSVQQAGAAYLAALVELTRTSSATAPEARPAAETEAALASLYDVADQMVQLAPNDPLSVRILQAFDQVEAPAPGSNEDDQIIWF